jgi:hypothetical protein
MNFNYNQKPEYDLNAGMITELINLYGVLTKFLIVEKINKDDTVFGDYSHLKSDSSKIYDIFMLPETSEEFDNAGDMWREFGLVNAETINLFVSRTDIEQIFTENIDEEKGFNGILGNLIVLPNNRIIEITDVDFQTPGINNLYTYNNTKSVYKLSCKTYDMKLINEVDNVDISVDENEEYETLDNYFNELIGDSNEQNSEASEIPQVTTVIKGTVDTKVNKPIIDKTEDSVFGGF